MAGRFFQSTERLMEQPDGATTYFLPIFYGLLSGSFAGGIPCIRSFGRGAIGLRVIGRPGESSQSGLRITSYAEKRRKKDLTVGSCLWQFPANKFKWPLSLLPEWLTLWEEEEVFSDKAAAIIDRAIALSYFLTRGG